jgi:hypothetical protein
MEGLLTARQYFNSDESSERELRTRITALWRDVDWNWFRATPKRDALYWHWSPNYAFHIAHRLQGWNEVMITYLLAIASPTNPIPPSTYWTGYDREGTGSEYGTKHTYFGIPLTQGYVARFTRPAVFCSYSYRGYDPRGVRDTTPTISRTTETKPW